MSVHGNIRKVNINIRTFEMVPAKALTLTSIWLKYTPACVLVGVAARMSLYLKP